MVRSSNRVDLVLLAVCQPTRSSCKLTLNFNHSQHWISKNQDHSQTSHRIDWILQHQIANNIFRITLVTTLATTINLDWSYILRKQNQPKSHSQKPSQPKNRNFSSNPNFHKQTIHLTLLQHNPSRTKQS